MAVQQSTEEYESGILCDKIGLGSFRMFDEVRSKRVSQKRCGETYSKWCTDSGLGVDGRNNFYTELKIKGIFAMSGTVNGKTVQECCPDMFE